MVEKIVISKDKSFIHSLENKIYQTGDPFEFRFVTLTKSARKKGKSRLLKMAEEKRAKIVFIEKEDQHNNHKLYAGTAIFYKPKSSVYDRLIV